MDKPISEILEELRQPLPEAAIKRHTNDPNKMYIENEWYEWWVMKIAGPLFRIEERSTEITDRYVKVVMRIHIGDVFRDGTGFKEIDGKLSLTNIVDLAKAEAERKGYDLFGMGWHNLGIYSRHGIPDALASRRYCIKCGSGGQPLSQEDIQFLSSRPHIKHDYHIDCIPSHLRR